MQPGRREGERPRPAAARLRPVAGGGHRAVPRVPTQPRRLRGRLRRDRAEAAVRSGWGEGGSERLGLPPSPPPPPPPPPPLRAARKACEDELSPELRTQLPRAWHHEVVGSHSRGPPPPPSLKSCVAPPPPPTTLAAPRALHPTPPPPRRPYRQLSSLAKLSTGLAAEAKDGEGLAEARAPPGGASRVPAFLRRGCRGAQVLEAVEHEKARLAAGAPPPRLLVGA